MRGRKSSFIAIAWVLLLSVFLGACGQGATGGTGDQSGGEAENGLQGKRIALIMQLNIGTFSAQYIDGVRDQVEKFGGELQVFNAEEDLARMASHLDSAITQQFDGILIDHGTPEALDPGIRKALEANIPVVVFDAAIDIEGVTLVEQGDLLLAEQTLEKLVEDNGTDANIVKIWVAGFAPMERRQVAYEEFQEKYPDVTELAAFGSATSNTALDTQSQMEAILRQYPNKGDITAVWAAWDEFAKGASRAIQQAGRDEIKVYGIDLSDEDLQMIQDPNNPWVASAAVDPSDIGRIQARLLYKKLNGDSDTPDRHILKPVMVTRDDLPEEPVTMSNLQEHVEEWGQSDDVYEDWMKELEEQVKGE
ncbi:sugar ABC transporter substrate-binding protein [Bacillus horti]|uniref:sugar ABC transporter substrate-binding protein n=1 Tax=Caldalkalibacillus horti TaxID=77523 RepID=UPI0027D929CD|nr:sugar ABC transporter substrate-binding protein [Bacillus horti]